MTWFSWQFFRFNFDVFLNDGSSEKIKISSKRTFCDKAHGVKKSFVSKVYPRQNRHSNIGKKESKPRLQVLLVVLERSNDQHPAPKEKERDTHTPCFRTRTPKMLAPKMGHQCPR